nr:immunoglobulin heavy chain junction region [Mus musculus]
LHISVQDLVVTTRPG